MIRLLVASCAVLSAYGGDVSSLIAPDASRTEDTDDGTKDASVDAGNQVSNFRWGETATIDGYVVTNGLSIVNFAVMGADIDSYRLEGSIVAQ